MGNQIYIGLTSGLITLLTGVTRLEADGDEDILRICKTFVKSSQLPAAIVGKDERVVVCNTALEKFIGRTQAQLQHLQFSEFTHPAYVEEDRIYFQKVFEPTVSFDNYKLWKIWLKPDNTNAQGLLEVYPLIKDGEVIFTLAIIHPDEKKPLREKMDDHKSDADKNIILRAMAIFNESDSRLSLLLAICVFMLIFAVMTLILLNGKEILDIIKSAIE